MIVVVGVPRWRAGMDPGPAGSAGRIAVAAAEGGAGVELIGRVGDDAAGDALVLALARANVGHVAVLRDPARATVIDDPGDPEEDELAAAADDDAAQPHRGSAPAAPELDAADLDLGLRYLTDYRVIVLADPLPPPAIAVAVDAARYASAHLVIVTAAGQAAPDGTGPDATVLEGPDADPGGDFARVVGAYAAALDRGETPAAAFRMAVDELGWQGAPADDI